MGEVLGNSEQPTIKGLTGVRVENLLDQVQRLRGERTAMNTADHIYTLMVLESVLSHILIDDDGKEFMIRHGGRDLPFRISDTKEQKGES
jgi:hypothetical protein